MVRKGPEKKRNYRECYSVTSPHHQEAWYCCRATVKVVNQSACEPILQTVKPATGPYFSNHSMVTTKYIVCQET